jgi:hypothetical protein
MRQSVVGTQSTGILAPEYLVVILQNNEEEKEEMY